MGFLNRYQVPPVPTAEPGSEEWHEQESARQSSLEFIRPTDRCFYCGELLSCEALVFWHGYGAQIWTHAKCALMFSAHLARDGLDAMKGPRSR
jgi:hypothetical protein